eukprot:912972-Amphidinium_carterae.1
MYIPTWCQQLARLAQKGWSAQLHRRTALQDFSLSLSPFLNSIWALVYVAACRGRFQLLSNGSPTSHA